MSIPDDNSIGLGHLTPRARNRLREEMRTEVEAEVREMFDRFLANIKGRLAEADRIIADHNTGMEAKRRGCMTRAEFMMIVASLHPDHNTYHRGPETFQLIRGLEAVLVKPEPKLLPGHHPAPPLPTLVLEPVIARYRRTVKHLYFRGDAALRQSRDL